MRILKSSVEIRNELKRLINTYSKYYWAVAWASMPPDLLPILIKRKRNIQKIIVGIHFYQTHPKFIKKFRGNERVKYIMEPSGVFHPKLYFFEYDQDNWELIIGSPNFTDAAFSRNTEIAVVITSDDQTDSNLRNEILGIIDGYWNQAKTLDSNEIEAYSNVWKRKRKLIGRVSGRYTSAASKRTKSPLEVEIFKMNWSEYFEKVKADGHHDLEGRILVLSSSRELFKKHNHFKSIPLEGRKGIAGFGKEDKVPWAWFGSMKGAGFFKNKVNENNELVSYALDEIPHKGDITENHYKAFKKPFLEAFDHGGAGIATATRLLSMKRPDYFICFDSQNKKKLCEAFEIPKNINIDKYWSMIVERIIDSVWWNSEMPINYPESEIWQGRAAFLDSIFYDPKN